MKNKILFPILLLGLLTTYFSCQKDIETKGDFEYQEENLFSKIDFNAFKAKFKNENVEGLDINSLINHQTILQYRTESESFVIGIDSVDVLIAEKDGITSYTFKTLTIDNTKVTNYILAHDENNNIDEYYITYENNGSSKIIDPTNGNEVTTQSRNSVWCPITEEQLVCTCKGHTVDECGGCNGWQTVTVVVGNEYCGGLGGEEGVGGGSQGNGNGNSEGTGNGSGTETSEGNDLPIDGKIITKPFENFNANIVLEDCLGYNNSAYFDVLLLDDINNNVHVEVKVAMASYLQSNGCTQETTDIIDNLVDYLIEDSITSEEAQLTLKTLSNDTPWTPNPGVYNGISSLAYTHTRTIVSNGRTHFQYLLENGDVLSVSSYPENSGSSELQPVLFYFSQETQLWYDFQEPSSYEPLTLDFLWDGFWVATRTVVALTTSIEDIIILIEGKDFEGVEQSRAVAGTFILVDFIPGSSVLKAIKMVKYGDELIQVGEAVVKYVDDIYKSQKETIQNVLEGLIDLDQFGNTIRKGNFGEMVTDEDLFSIGYEALHVRRTNIDQPLDTGIDGVFKNPETDEFIIVESKYNTAQLSNTLDGKQMSDDWIQGTNTGFDRLEAEVGEELANEIYSEGYKRVKATIMPDGSISYQELNSAGEVIGTWTP